MIENGARHFEDFDGLVYLNCANQGPIPRVTALAIRESLEIKIYPNRVPDTIYFDLPNRARSAAARIIGAERDEIVIGSGAAHGMNLAALGFPWRPGDEVVLASNEFPSNVYIWVGAARRAGAKAVVVRGKRRTATTNELLAAITPRTRVVVVSLVDYGSGEVHDVERIGRLCRERDIFLAVDGTQAAGVMPVNVRGLGASLFAVGGYKWMLAPYGVGFAWLDPAWYERIPPVYVAWAAAAGAENFNAMPREEWSWVETARRFDGAEASSYLNVTGLARSGELLLEIGIEAIHDHVAGWLARLEEALPEPFRRRASPAPLAGPILCLEADRPEPVHEAYRRLREAGVWVSMREDGLRFSPHIYNTEAQIETVLGLLSAG